MRTPPGSHGSRISGRREAARDICRITGLNMRLMIPMQLNGTNILTSLRRYVYFSHTRFRMTENLKLTSPLYRR